jgi:hypothetical protein
MDQVHLALRPLGNQWLSWASNPYTKKTFKAMFTQVYYNSNN